MSFSVIWKITAKYPNFFFFAFFFNRIFFFPFFLRFQRHELTHCYVAAGLQVKLPSLPFPNNGGTLDGYDFSSETNKKAGYYYVLEQFHRLGPNGSEDFRYK